MSTPPIERLLIVGLGSIGKRHARLAREIVPGIEIIALRHNSCEAWQSMGVDHCVTTLADAVAFAPQAAVIASPATFHLNAALQLARAGVHLLIEKPMADVAQGINDLIEVCRSGRVTLMVGYNMRFLPSLRRFRELLREERVGRVLSVRAEVGQYLPSWRVGTDYREGVSAKARLGGGVLLELSHEIDYLRWIFGEVESVSAIRLRQSDLEIDVEDTAHLVLSFVSARDAKPVVAALSLDFIRHDHTRYCTVIGDKGTLRWNALTGTVDLFEQESSDWESLFTHRSQRDDSHVAEWHSFVNSIRTGQPAPITGSDGLAVLQIIQAARLSSDGGVSVAVERGEAIVEFPGELQ